MRGRPHTPSPSTFVGQIGARIRARRVELDRTVEEAAKAAKVAVPTWYHWEAGRHLQIQRLPAIAKALQCDVVDLIPPGSRGARHR